MSSQPTCWRVSRAAWPVIVPAIGAEAFSNALRAYGLGAHLHDFTVTALGHRVSLAGGVLVLAALAVSLSQARAAWVALTPGVARQRIVCGGAAALLLAISITAMISLILEAQRAKSGHEGTDRAAYERADAAYKTAKADFERIADVRPVDVIDQEIRTETAAILADDERRPIWRRTGQCADISRPASAAACATILSLRQEIAAANARTEIEERYTKAQGVLTGLSRTEEASTSESYIDWIWAWLIGFGVVLLATFGTVIFARVGATDSHGDEVSDTRQNLLRTGETQQADAGASTAMSPTPTASGISVPPTAAETPDMVPAAATLEVAKCDLKSEVRGERPCRPARTPRSMADRIARASATALNPLGPTRLPESVPANSESFPENVVARFPERVPARMETFPQRLMESVPERFLDKAAAILPRRMPGNPDAADLLAVLVTAGRPLSNAELAAAWRVSEGEASKRVTALGTRVRRVKVGRGVQITLASGPHVPASGLLPNAALH